MACSKPVLQGQSPASCQFCEDSKIQWKCIDCDLLLCTKCKDKNHSKVKTAKAHNIKHIKEVGTQFNEGSKGTSTDKQTEHSTNQGHVNLELSIITEYSTEFHISNIQTSLDDSLWIGSAGDKKDTFFTFKSSRHLQKVKLNRDNLKIISSFNIKFYDFAITQTNDLILTDGTPKLKQILHNSANVRETNYCVDPYDAWSVHVTRDNKVVVGIYSRKDELDAAEGFVYVMDINGVHQKIYRHDNNNKPLFTLPERITSTNTGTLCVMDKSFDPYKGRLVMLDQGEVIGIYTGHPDINNDTDVFIPYGVVCTSNDNIIATDPDNNTLHMLNNTGRFLTYYDTQKIGILFHWSLALNTAGQFSILYIGCWAHDRKGKLYKLTLSGC